MANTPDISATVAEKQAPCQPKRGRPSLLTATRQTVINMASDNASVRGRQDVHYRLRAIGALSEGDPLRIFDERIRWLYDDQGCRAGKPHAWRPTVLTELGRIDDVEELREAALWICGNPRLSSRQAVVLLRQRRLDRHRPACPNDLASLLARTLNDYRLSHPDLALHQVVDALRALEWGDEPILG